MSIETIIAAYGYPAVLAATFFEGETALVIAGFLANRGYMALPWVMFFAFIGAFSGDQMFFLIGRRKGMAFVAKRPLWQERVKRVQPVLERYQTAVMLGFRFVYGFRITTPFVIGAAGFSPARFAVFNAIGAAAWAVIISAAGYLFGRAVQAVLGDIKKYEAGVLLCIVAFAALMFVLRHLRGRRLKSNRDRATIGKEETNP